MGPFQGADLVGYRLQRDKILPHNHTMFVGGIGCSPMVLFRTTRHQEFRSSAVFVLACDINGPSPEEEFRLEEIRKVPVQSIRVSPLRGQCFH